MKLLVVGNPGDVHVGAHFLEACATSGVEARLCDTREAYSSSFLRQKVNWWMRGHRPARLREFSDEVVAAVKAMRPGAVLTTGLAPVDARGLRAIGALGVPRLNYLTDDPWNPAQRAPWFMDAIEHYDHVFSPRRANLTDLSDLGLSTTYLPFAYAPAIHFPESATTPEERAAYDTDVVFVGGADADRVPMAAALIDAGLSVALYGGYWDRYPETCDHARGHLDPAGVRRAIAGARVSLGLVRRANRDGHSMRTFEVPAMAGCLLVERTDEHAELLGADGDAVVFFDGATQAAERAARLVADPDQVARLRNRAHARITRGQHTYADRLAVILETVQRASMDSRQRAHG